MAFSKPDREFLYLDDMATACLHVMNLDKKTYDQHTEPMLSHINVGSNEEDMTIAGLLGDADRVEMALNPARRAYVHLVWGDLLVNEELLSGCDAALISGESSLTLDDAKDAEFHVFDLTA